MERPRRSAALDQWEVERSAFDPEALAARLVAAEPRDRDAAELLAAVPGTVEWLRGARPALYDDRAPARERALRAGERPAPPRGWIRADAHEPFDARRPRPDEPEVEASARELDRRSACYKRSVRMRATLADRELGRGPEPDALAALTLSLIHISEPTRPY